MQNNGPDSREQIPLDNGVETSAGTGEAKTPHQPDPMTTDILKAKKLQESDLKTGEGTQVHPGGRVADAGDASGGPAIPYDIEAQADSVGRQSASVKTDEAE
ncbi:hypothetical protein AAIH46_06360 [Rhizobium sp. 0TCS1.26]|uniref:hypothetical protein n=1 Tax=Rhizobium sp. 0TCS1.26 TaxID=3142623 RepID=UPI003D2D6B2C